MKTLKGMSFSDVSELTKAIGEIANINSRNLQYREGQGKGVHFSPKWLLKKLKQMFPAVLCVGRQELEGMEYSWGSGKYF